MEIFLLIAALCCCHVVGGHIADLAGDVHTGPNFFQACSLCQVLFNQIHTDYTFLTGFSFRTSGGRRRVILSYNRRGEQARTK